MANLRQSNFELLRLLAMLMILVVHFDGAALGLPVPSQAWDTADWVKTFVEAFSIIGVNLFVMISGFFGIRMTGSRLMSFIGMCLFYSSGIYILWLMLDPQADFTIEGATQALLVFSHGDLWFVRDYLMLMLLAPLLNAGLHHLDRHHLNVLIGGLAVINFYFGWIQGGAVNPAGYCLMQLISVYILGYRLRGVMLSALWSAVIWAGGYALIVISAIFLPPAKAYAYNSPAVVMASIGMFMLFANVHFTSKVVNGLARHTFAVYLIHKDPIVWRHLKHDIVLPLYKGLDGVHFVIYISLVTILIYAICIAIDYVRGANVRFFSQIFLNFKKME